VRRGAGSMPAARKISQTVDGATVTPSFISSPWIRRCPHSGFSFARRTMSRATPGTGVVVIVTGVAIAFVVTAVRLSRRESAVYLRFRQQLGQAILLGLELLVAGDIVRTVAASPSLTSVAILAAIVFIRTFLSFSLEVETTGRWPWQKHGISAS